MGLLKEFREFSIRGNAIDLAVGMTVGVAFSNVVKSLVEDIVMPPIGLLLGRIDFSNLHLNLGAGSYATVAQAQAANQPILRYGMFLQQMVNFAIVSFCVFMLVKVINSIRREQPKPPPPPENITLLREIRDALREKQSLR